MYLHKLDSIFLKRKTKHTYSLYFNNPMSAGLWHFAKTNNCPLESSIKIPPPATTFKPVGMCDRHREGDLNGRTISESLWSSCLDSADHMTQVHETIESLWVDQAHPRTLKIKLNHEENCKVFEINMIWIWGKVSNPFFSLAVLLVAL